MRLSKDTGGTDVLLVQLKYENLTKAIYLRKRLDVLFLRAHSFQRLTYSLSLNLERKDEKCALGVCLG